MNTLMSNRLFRIGAITALVGWTPLLAVVLLELLGVLRGSNPIGLGLLFFVTFWPAVICMGLGAFRVWRARGQTGDA